MGNQISFDFDEVYLKFGLESDKSIEDLCFRVPYCISKKIKNTNFIFGKISLNDIEEKFIQNKMECEKLKQAITKYITLNCAQILKQQNKKQTNENAKIIENGLQDDQSTISTNEIPEDAIPIYVTGYGFDVFIDKISFFFSQFVPKFIFRKYKQIKAFVIALDYLIKLEKSSFYTLEAYDILKLNDLSKDEMMAENIKKIYLEDTSILESSPYMILNIKSGVSYYLVDNKNKFRRLSGSIIGESTFLSLVNLLTDYKTVEEAIDDSFLGDNRTVDMTVGDIYGGSYESLGLNKDIIASSMGKAKNQNFNEVKKQDLIRSIITMLSINISQLAVMISNTEKIQNIIMIGSILNHVGFLRIFKSFLTFWGLGKLNLYFVDNVEYLACIGMKLEIEEKGSEVFNPYTKSPNKNQDSLASKEESKE